MPLSSPKKEKELLMLLILSSLVLPAILPLYLAVYKQSSVLLLAFLCQVLLGISYVQLHTSVFTLWGSHCLHTYTLCLTVITVLQKYMYITDSYASLVCLLLDSRQANINYIWANSNYILSGKLIMYKYQRPMIWLQFSSIGL